MKTYSTVNAKTYNISAWVFCTAIALLVIYALVFGNVNGFDNAYISK